MERVTVAHLRQRARHYRALAEKEKDPLRRASHLQVAELLDREADAVRDEEAKRTSGTTGVLSHCRD